MTIHVDDRTLAKRLCWGIVAVQIAFFILTICRPWIPDHDGLYSLLIFRNFAANFAAHGEFPLWAPLLDWGKPLWIETLRHISPGMFFITPLSSIAAKLGIGAVPLFYFSLLLSELFLGVGCWALAGRLYQKPLSAVFVTFALVGSLNYFRGLIPNLSAYYALPFCFYWWVRGVQESRATWYFLSVLTLIVSGFFGDAGYYIVASGLALGAFGLTSLIVLRTETKIRFIFKKMDFLLLAMILTIAAAAGALVLRLGWPHIYTVGRGGIGRSGYDTFLNYGPTVDFSISALDLLAGITHNRDFILFAGFLIPPLAWLGLVSNRDRKILPALVTLIVIVLFALGAHSFMAPLMYYIPVAPFFRHVAMALPLTKVCVVLMAGHGIDALLQESSTKARTSLVKIFSGMTLSVLALTFFHYRSVVFSPGVSARLILLTAGCIAVFIAYQRISFSPRGFTLLLFLVLGIDIVSYRIGELNSLMYRLEPKMEGLFKLATPSYLPRRTFDYLPQARFDAFSDYFKSDAPGAKKEFVDCFHSGRGCQIGEYIARGATYDALEDFLGIDSCKSAFRSDHHLPTVHWLYDLESDRGERFPSGLNAVVGCEASKVLLFAGPTVFDNDEAQRAYMKKLNGESILTTTQAEWKHFSARSNANLTSGGNEIPAQVPAYEVTQFSANHWGATVHNTTGAMHWLYYADAWHPRWSARVNGQPVPILQVNQGFKAVPIPPGEVTVNFDFGTAFDYGVSWLLWIISAAFIALPVVWVAPSLTFRLPIRKKQPLVELQQS
jgi:hypothetical protein